MVLDPADRRGLLGSEVVVEEKLDGANVMVWVDDRGQPQVSLRSGPGSADRAGQLGPLRAWATGHGDGLRGLLDGGRVLYGEWLLLSHTVSYQRLPDYLVALDLWDRQWGWVPVDVRSDACGRAALTTPPELWRGVPGSAEQLEALLGPAAWGAGPMEGLVVRHLDGGRPRLAKLVSAGWRPIDDDAWRAGRPRNGLAEGAAAWR